MTTDERIQELVKGIEAARPLLAMANEAGCFKNCAAPLIGERTLAMLERLTGPSTVYRPTNELTPGMGIVSGLFAYDVLVSLLGLPVDGYFGGTLDDDEVVVWHESGQVYYVWTNTSEAFERLKREATSLAQGKSK